MFDWLVQYGAKLSSGDYIPGRTTGLAADGGALTHGPNKLIGGVQADLEPVSNAGVPAAISASSPYSVGDDDNGSDTLFARVLSDGDDRLIGVDPAATGIDLAFLDAYTV